MTTTHAAAEQFTTRDPATGLITGRWPVDGPAVVAERVDRARLAARWWADLDPTQRRARLLAWKRLVARRLDELADVVHRETGKPHGDAVLEIVAAIEHIDWSARHAASVLGRRAVRPGVLSMNQRAWLEYQPLGVIGVIGPWNYPVLTPLGSIAYALAAGNAVVFKPSELTPATGAWLVDVFAEVVGEQPVLALVTGPASTGEALCQAGVDKIAFTGSARTGRAVMASCAQSLTPVLMECGGKDAMVVDVDADLDAAADAAAWGGLSNAGQTCVGIERVYVAAPVYEEFLARLVAKVRDLRPGSDDDADYGPATLPAQLDVIDRHVRDALDRGAHAVVGGADAVHGRYVDPVVLTDVPEDAPAVTEETFGPTLTVARVRDGEEGVDRANASPYALGGAVFGKANGVALARRMRSGMTSVNAALAFAFVPSLPFGGSGESGFGRIHGEDGLREFSRAKAVTSQWVALPVALTSFSRSPRTTRALVTAVEVLHGGRRFL